jgi:hypothetical protein
MGLESMLTATSDRVVSLSDVVENSDDFTCLSDITPTQPYCLFGMGGGRKSKGELRSEGQATGTLHPTR